jgi:four helix bundle protein
MGNYSEEFRLRCFKFGTSVFLFLKPLNYNSIFRPIIDQLVRSSSSIGANVTEAKNSSSSREFKRYFEIALKSANETKFWLAFLRSTSDCSPERIDELAKEAGELANILAASVITLKKNMKKRTD